MKTDVKQLENAYEVDIDLPGFKKDDVSVSLENGYLTVSGAKSLDNSRQDDDKNFIRREHYYGSCSRSFYVGNAVTREDVSAKLEERKCLRTAIILLTPTPKRPWIVGHGSF